METSHNGKRSLPQEDMTALIVCAPNNRGSLGPLSAQVHDLTYFMSPRPWIYYWMLLYLSRDFHPQSVLFSVCHHTSPFEERRDHEQCQGSQNCRKGDCFSLRCPSSPDLVKEKSPPMIQCSHLPICPVNHLLPALSP